tara:strand:+ start:213 stop:656 length:444 start_codon:yes stop_codon:yes gene_type:complete
MALWIFQGNPDLFDVDEALLDPILHEQGMTWLVTSNKSKIKIGDEVLIYRTGRKNAIIGLCEVFEEPREQPPDPNVVRHWTAKAIEKGLQSRDRCWLEILEHHKHGISFETIKQTKGLEKVAIGTQQTNISTDPMQRKILRKLWAEL